MEFVVIYAMTFIGTPYHWGGNGTEQFPGYDCSGFIQQVLGAFGAVPKFDQNADSLYRYFKKHQKSKFILKKGSLLFFGKKTQISHVAMAIDTKNMLEAGGGGKNFTKKNASVRIRPIKSRSDLIAYILPYVHPKNIRESIILKKTTGENPL